MSLYTFTEIQLRRQQEDPDYGIWPSDGIEEADRTSLDQLLAANTDAKLREFTAGHFPFTHIPRSQRMPDFDEEVRAASDTRDLMMLALQLKQMIDEETCAKKSFERLGVRFYEGGSEEHEQSELFFLFSSPELAEYLRTTNQSAAIEEKLKIAYTKTGAGEAAIDASDLPPFATIGYAKGSVVKLERLFANGQRERAESLEDDKAYPVMPIFGGNLGRSTSYGSERAYFLIDSIMHYCLQGVRVGSKRGLVNASADTNFTSMWLRLSETFRASRVSMCKTCGLPIIATNERGSKRLYCNDACKRKYKRAQKFVLLVNGGEAEAAAAKAAGIAATTAYRIVGQQP